MWMIQTTTSASHIHLLQKSILWYSCFTLVIYVHILRSQRIQHTILEKTGDTRFEESMVFLFKKNYMNGYIWEM